MRSASVHATNQALAAGPADRLCARPRMILYPGFLDKARCEHVIKMAKARLRPSSLALRKTDTADKIRCAPGAHGRWATLLGRASLCSFDKLQKMTACATLCNIGQ